MRIPRSILLLCALALAFPLFSEPAAAQQQQPVERPYPEASPPYGIAAKRPVFGGACMVCPWGILAIATNQALKPYGYDVQHCWTCATSYGPRLMADKIKPEVRPNFDPNRAQTGRPPDAVLDIAATSEINLLDAWNGVGEYVEDKKQRRNYRVVAALQLPNYLLAAARKDTGITDLSQVKDRKRPTWVYADDHNPTTQAVLKYYGITEEALKANRGGFIEGVNSDMRAQADVIVHNGHLVNTPEQNVWYQATQHSDLVFMGFDRKLIDELVKREGYYAVTTPAYHMRGMDKRYDTVMRVTHYIYVRDDAPDEFVYTVTKALDEQSHVFRLQAEPFYYDPKLVAVSKTIPLHPAAQRYYREVGYLK